LAKVEILQASAKVSAFQKSRGRKKFFFIMHIRKNYSKANQFSA
jgi:hypothetical protein